MSDHLLLHKPGQQILSLFARYSHLTGEQAVRLSTYSLGSRTFVMDWLKRLTDAKYLAMANYVDTNCRNPGTRPGVWSTTNKGRRVLEEMGFELIPRPHHNRERAQLTLLHTMAVNDVLIAGELFARVPGVSLLAIEHESRLRRYPVAVSANGREEKVILDGFLAFDMDGAESCLAIEADRGTEPKPEWQHKIANLVAFASPSLVDPKTGERVSPFRERFGYEALQVAVYVRRKGGDNAERMDALVRWTEEQLARMGKPSWGSYFRFTHREPVDDPTGFFLGPHWVSSFDPQPTSLVTLEVSRG